MIVLVLTLISAALRNFIVFFGFWGLWMVLGFPFSIGLTWFVSLTAFSILFFFGLGKDEPILSVVAFCINLAILWLSVSLFSGLYEAYMLGISL